MVGTQSRCTLVLNQMLYTLYLFTPTVAVLMAEGWKFRQVFSAYGLTLRKMNGRSWLKSIVLTAIALPAIMLIFIYVLGNWVGIDGLSRIVTQTTDSYTFNGITLSDNGIVRLLTLSGLALGMSLVVGLTYNLLLALGGELAWRGFLEKNLTLTNFHKSLIIGLVWSIWTLPIILLSGKSGIECMYSFGLSILSCVVLSFFLSNVLKRTGTLFAPASVIGIIQSCSWLWLLDGAIVSDPRLIGFTGLLTSLAIFIINLGFSGKPKY